MYCEPGLCCTIITTGEKKLHLHTLPPPPHTEEKLKEELNHAKELTRTQSQPQEAFACIASAARTANRVVAISKNEAENSLDPEFKSSLEQGQDAVTKCTFVSLLIVTSILK